MGEEQPRAESDGGRGGRMRAAVVGVDRDAGEGDEPAAAGVD